MEVYKVILFLQLFAFVSLQDPCLEGNHKVVNNAVYRSVGYQDDIVRSDRFLPERWYRFDSPAGNEMPTQAPELGSCGSLFPIWLDDSKTVQGQNGEQKATACVVSFGDNCVSAYDIKLKRCSGFTVYFLVPTDGTSESYCIGTEVECPEGTSSETGFTPNCVRDGFPDVKGSAEITYRVDVDGIFRKVSMLCNLVLEEEIDDIFLDVSWYFDTKELKAESEQVSKGNLPAVFSQDSWSRYDGIGHTLSCELRARFSSDSVPGRKLKAEYYMGFKTTTPTITVEEGDEGAEYKFYSTIPILVPVGFENDLTAKLTVDVIVPKIAACPGVCQSTEAVVQFKADNVDGKACGVKIPHSPNVGPDNEFSIRVNAVTDAQYDGDNRIVMKLRTAKAFRFNSIWSNKTLPSATIVVMDKDVEMAGAYCKSRDDPHMTTFDGRIYENQLEGEFVMYRHTVLPIEVQAYYKKCNSYATCNCGAAVRAGGDLFIYDHCRPGKPLRQRLYSCEDEALSYVHKNGAYEVTILPTGTKVRIGRSFVEIYPSPKDYRRTKGLCGTFDSNCANDFELRDGSTDPHPKATKASCDRRTDWDRYFHPNKFSNSWRVQRRESLYRGEIPNVDRDLPGTIYCDCSSEDPNTARCQKTATFKYCTQPDDPPINECIKRRRKREAGHMDDDVEEEVEMFEFSSEFVPPDSGWKQGWSEERAHKYCINYLEQRSSTKTCLELNVVDLQSALTSCETDIWLSGDTSFTPGHLEDILNCCETEVKRNVTYYSVPEVEEGESTGTPPILDLLACVCPSDCSDHGTCVNNTCQCEENYAGDDCSVHITIPILFDMQFGSVCDLNSRPCEATPVYGETFVNSENLKCKVVAYIQKEDGEWVLTAEEHIDAAEFSNENRVFCPLFIPALPEDTLTYGFDISISNDGQTFSKPKPLTIVHSGCMDCDRLRGEDRVQCSLNESYCYIDRRCIDEGETEVGNNCYVCNSETSPYVWTETDGSDCSKPGDDQGCANPDHGLECSDNCKKLLINACNVLTEIADTMPSDYADLEAELEQVFANDILSFPFTSDNKLFRVIDFFTGILKRMDNFASRALDSDCKWKEDAFLEDLNTALEQMEEALRGIRDALPGLADVPPTLHKWIENLAGAFSARNVILGCFATDETP